VFSFDGVEEGEYEIIAGSDADNDLLICDSGEACGAWLTTDQPIRIEVSEDIDELNFPVEYLVALPSLSASGRTNGAANENSGRQRPQ